MSLVYQSACDDLLKVKLPGELKEKAMQKASAQRMPLGRAVRLLLERWCSEEVTDAMLHPETTKGMYPPGDTLGATDGGALTWPPLPME